MPTATYIQFDFVSELALPLPLSQIFEFAKKNRAPSWRSIAKEIELIANDNKEKIIELMGDSVVKAMTEEITLGNVSDKSLAELNSKIDYLNSKFEHLNNYFEGLGAYDQRKLLLPFIDKESNVLAKYREEFRKKVTSKTEWNSTDALIYSYYLIYQDCINLWRITLKKASKDNIRASLNTIKILLFAYKPLLFAYMSNKSIQNELLVKKLAQLRSSVNPVGIYPLKSTVYDPLKAISVLPPS